MTQEQYDRQTAKILRDSDSPRMRFGGTTERFFIEGAQHEAAEWTDTVLPPDDEPEVDPEAQFDSFDKVPRRPHIKIAIAAIGFGLLVGIGVGVKAALRTGHVVQASVEALVAPDPHQDKAGQASSLAPTPPAPMVAPLSPERPAAEAAPSREPARSETSVGASPSAAVVPPQAIVESRKSKRQPEPRPRPLHGYVWSPAANALVPADAPEY